LALALRGIRRPPVLQSIDLEVGAGEVVGLLGANGAGKSTLLMVAAGLRHAEGVVHAGVVGWLGEPGPIPRTTAQLLALIAHGHGLGPDAVDAVAARIPLAQGSVESLSAGERRLVLLAVATLHDPPVLLLDEPLTHLDEQGAAVVEAEIRRAKARGAAVLVATHRAPELPLDRTVRLVDGRIG